MTLRVVKTILWFLAGLGLTVVVARILNGPGSVTYLTDILPWGLWKGGGVIALVAIGGAGFTVAMFVFIFQWDRYRPLVRGAVLLGLLCYMSVAVGLTFDIGIWWRIVFPVWHWQFHSVLFEVAWCIMLYLVVLLFEFGHTLLERYEQDRMLRIMQRFTLVLVIAGISLSTLHQSSLGTLFLATPFRLHPLWHTDLLPVLFFVSAMGVGCLTISLVTLFAHGLYNAEPPMNAISGLARISAYLLAAYVVLRLTEIVVSGESSLLVSRSWDTLNFWIEISLSALIPIVFLLRRDYRWSKTAVFWIALMATAGVTLNRVNVAGLATTNLTRSFYFPAWTEWAVTLGILSAGGLVFLFAVDHLGLFPGLSKERVIERYEAGQLDHTDWAALYFGGQRFGEGRLYSLVFIVAAALSLGLLSEDSLYGVSPVESPTYGARAVVAHKIPMRGDGAGTQFAIGNSGVTSEETAGGTHVLLIDGNRNGDYVLFDHDSHAETLAEGAAPEAACGACHHMAKPFDETTECFECHSDMYLTVDVFDHALHVRESGGNQGCAECHQSAALPKTRVTAAECTSCHEDMRKENARVQVTDSARKYLAPGHMDVMHELCVTCHEERQPTLPVPNEHFSRCTNCHQGLPPLGSDEWRATGLSIATYKARRESGGQRKQ
jgi:Ni/Fe-hydrogenase subunit HybB-like protein